MIIIYFVSALSLVSILWIAPDRPPLWVFVVVAINTLHAAIVANREAEQFYKWFTSHLK
jgi:hypothetical protein